MKLTLLAVLLFLSACSYFPTRERTATQPPAKEQKPATLTEMTCYQDCRSDLQTDDFCRARCSD